jgi:hypothetical protein
MRSQQVRRLPVVDDEGRLCGILSLADIAQRAAKDAKGKAGTKQVGFAEVGETFAAVTTPRRLELAAAASFTQRLSPSAHSLVQGGKTGFPASLRLSRLRISRQKAGRSDGCRDVTRLRSTTTSAST